MGYIIYELHYSGHVSSHNSDRDVRDRSAFDRFEAEVKALIDSDPEYTRVFGDTAFRYPVRVESVQPGLLHYVSRHPSSTSRSF